jgi:hypothetical protein
MSRPGIEPGPPAWEASTLEKGHLDSLYTSYSEPLLIMSLLHPDLYNTVLNIHIWKSWIFIVEGWSLLEMESPS